MSKFKKGDVIMRTVHDMPTYDMYIGQVCKVSKCGTHFLSVNRSHYGFNPDHFELATVYPNKPHVHADLIKAWADGATIQFWSDTRARSGKDGWMETRQLQSQTYQI